MMNTDSVLLLPTYNERENLVAMVHALRTVYRGRILVIDDNSPDGTGEIADELARADTALAVLHRQAKEGLGRAYVEGIRLALEDGAEAILTMDADFSHDPVMVPVLLRKLQVADLVIGSRYVPGGDTPGWPRSRRLISRAANIYARTLLGNGVRDYTAGFRAYRSACLRQIRLETLRATGYAFQVETAYRFVRAGFHVVEVPIRFGERMRGDSKLTPRIGVEALFLIPKLAVQRLFVLPTAQRAPAKRPLPE